MITFVAQIDGQKVLGLGLTDGNIEKLKRQPIALTGEQLGLNYPMNLLIFWGVSNEEMEVAIHKGGKYGPGIDAEVGVDIDT
jgi:hypothetical protein